MLPIRELAAERCQQAVRCGPSWTSESWAASSTGCEARTMSCGLSSLDGGHEFPVDALTLAPRFIARADLHEQLGGTLTDHPTGAFITTGPMGRTEIPGVWAAGTSATSERWSLPQREPGSRLPPPSTRISWPRMPVPPFELERKPPSPLPRRRLTMRVLGERPSGLDAPHQSNRPQHTRYPRRPLADRLSGRPSAHDRDRAGHPQ